MSTTIFALFFNQDSKGNESSFKPCLQKLWSGFLQKRYELMLWENPGAVFWTKMSKIDNSPVFRITKGNDMF